jgi:hypothetical protein
VPDEIRSLYEEASACEFASAYRGAAGLYRACVEALVTDQKTTGRTLKEQVDQLRAKGLDGEILAGLHEARLTGNWSLHSAVAFSAEEIGDVADLIREAVERIYVEPARRQDMRSRRSQRRKKPGP